MRKYPKLEMAVSTAGGPRAADIACQAACMMAFFHPFHLFVVRPGFYLAEKRFRDVDE